MPADLRCKCFHSHLPGAWKALIPESACRRRRKDVREWSGNRKARARARCRAFGTNFSRRARSETERAAERRRLSAARSAAFQRRDHPGGLCHRPGDDVLPRHRAQAAGDMARHHLGDVRDPADYLRRPSGPLLGSRQGCPSRVDRRQPAGPRLRRLSFRRRLAADAASAHGAARHFAYPDHGEPADAVRPLHRAARPRCRLRQLRHRQRGRAGARSLSGRLGRRIGDVAADRPPFHDRTDRLLCVAGDRRRHPAGAGSPDAAKSKDVVPLRTCCASAD